MDFGLWHSCRGTKIRRFFRAVLPSHLRDEDHLPASSGEPAAAAPAMAVVGRLMMMVAAAAAVVVPAVVVVVVKMMDLGLTKPAMIDG